MKELDTKDQVSKTDKPKEAEEQVVASDAQETVKPTQDKPAVPKKKKSKRLVPFGQVHIMSSFNNTIISVTDNQGGVLTAASAGASGFRGSKKGTAYAAQIAAEKAYHNAKQSHGLTKADVFVKGIGLGRDAAVRTLQNVDIKVESIKDVTGVPHGGVRPKKARRT